MTSRAPQLFAKAISLIVMNSFCLTLVSLPDGYAYSVILNQEEGDRQQIEKVRVSAWKENGAYFLQLGVIPYEECSVYSREEQGNYRRYGMGAAVGYYKSGPDTHYYLKCESQASKTLVTIPIQLKFFKDFGLGVGLQGIIGGHKYFEVDSLDGHDLRGALGLFRGTSCCVSLPLGVHRLAANNDNGSRLYLRTMACGLGLFASYFQIEISVLYEKMPYLQSKRFVFLYAEKDFTPAVAIKKRLQAIFGQVLKDTPAEDRRAAILHAASEEDILDEEILQTVGTRSAEMTISEYEDFFLATVADQIEKKYLNPKRSVDLMKKDPR